MKANLDQEAGPWLTCALEKLMEWQLENPDKDQDAAKDWVRENKDMLLGK